MQWLVHLAVFILLVVAPALDPPMTALLKRSTNPFRRLWNYAFTILLIGFSATVGVLFLQSDWLKSPATWAHWPLLLLACLIAAALVYAVGRPVVKVLCKPELRLKVHRKFEPVAFMLPQNRAERWAFLLVCIFAGVGEEIIFRNFLPRYFMAAPFHFPFAVAALISTAAFGLNHLYQGARGVLSTAIIGLLLFVLVVGSGSLIPAMVIHFMLDVRILALTLEEGALSRAEAAEALKGSC
jgi:membrane protease YdiL (CAAX protease family)